ncbi:MAG: MFS transporter [Nanoarchaeota archaeon]|nr:MFS transporter [Nanoarchaeota archaeon]
MFEHSKRNFTLLIFGQFISLIGDRILIAMYLSIVAILVSSTNSWTSNLLIIIQFLPLLLLGFYFGSLADVYNRKLLLIISESIRTVSILILLFFQDNLYLIYFSVILLGLGYAIFEPARKSIIPFLVPPKKLISLNKLYASLELLALLTGLFIASIILQFISINLALLVVIITYVISIISLFFIQYNHKLIKEELSKEEEEKLTHTKIISNDTSNTQIITSHIVRIKKGLIYVKENSRLRSIFIVVLIHFIACCMFFATLNDFVIKTTPNSIDVGSIVSLYLFIVALGALSAYPLLTILKNIRDGILTVFSLAFGTILLLLFAINIEFLIYEIYPFVSWLILYFIGIIVGVQYLRFMYLLQIHSKKEFLGRVMSVFEFITSVSIMIGIGIGMLLSELLGFDIVFFLIVLVYGFGFLYFFVRRTLLTW